MNRKLQRTVTALSATATVLTMMLLAGGPARIAEPGAALVLATTVEAASVAAAEVPSAGQRRHLRRSRAALALPYFSFAQGLRRSGS